MFDVQGARKAGATDDQILQHLTKSRNYDVQGALKAGATKQQIIEHLAKNPTKSSGPETHALNKANPNYQQNLEAANKLGREGGVKNFLKAIPRALTDTVLGTTARTAVSLKEAPALFRKDSQASGKTYNLPGLSPFKSIQSDASETFDQVIEGQQPLVSALGPVAESVIGPIDAATVMSGATKGMKMAAKAAPEFLAKASEKAAERAVKKASEEALEIIRPKLTPTEQAARFKQGDGSTSGVLKTARVTPNAKELEMADVTRGVVKKSNSPFDNITALKNEVKSSATKVRSGLEQSDAIWNQNELKGKLAQVEVPITVKSDRTLSNQAKNFDKAVLQLAEKANKKTVGLLDVRQNFDDLVAREFPNLYDKEMTPMRQYIRSVRQLLNDLVEAKIPDGQLPDGSSFKAELRRQHLMMEAIDNIAEKAPKEGENAIRAWIKKNPIQAGIIEGVAGSSILGGLYQLIKR